jgi:enoyl-CoA hydratase/carnithine racemase
MLARGEHNNALGPDLVCALRKALTTETKHNAVLITAEGRNFCQGGDHDELGALSAEEYRRYLAELVGLFADLAAARVPVVTAVHRAVVGGGLEMCLLADFVIAADDAWFQLPQIGLGGRIGTYTYSNLIARCGLGATRRLVMLGERLDASAALSIGLVDYVVSRPQLEKRGIQLARELADRPVKAMRRARSDLSDILGAAQTLQAEAQRRSTEAPPR